MSSQSTIEKGDIIAFKLHGSVHIGNVKGIVPRSAVPSINGYDVRYEYQIANIKPPLNDQKTIVMSGDMLTVIESGMDRVKQSIQDAKTI